MVGAGAIRFGLRIPPCAPATAVAASVVAAERAGFDVAWLPDSQFLWRDVWTCLGLAATQTSTITLGPCVTNFETRHVSVTAAAAATLGELAPGRTVVGVGSGDSSIKTLGRRPTRVAVMESRLAELRRLLRGDELDFEGRTMRLHATPPEPVPIYLAANGPRMLELAARTCDGVLMLTGFRPELIAASRTTIDRGRAGREVDVCVGALCHGADERHEAVHVVKPHVVATAQTGGGRGAAGDRGRPRATCRGSEGSIPTWRTPRTGTAPLTPSPRGSTTRRRCATPAPSAWSAPAGQLRRALASCRSRPGRRASASATPARTRSPTR